MNLLNLNTDAKAFYWHIQLRSWANRNGIVHYKYTNKPEWTIIIPAFPQTVSAYLLEYLIPIDEQDEPI